MSTPLSIRSGLAALALASVVHAQVLVTQDATTDTLVAFSPVDGSLLGTVFPINNTTSVGAIDVNGEIWISEQTATRITRYDRCGNVVGTIEEMFPGGGINNIRGMAFVNGLVYVTNSGTGNGAPGNAIVVFDPAGNFVTSWSVQGTATSPFSIIPFQGDFLVAGSSGSDDVHRFTQAGVSLGTFHNSGSVNFSHQIAPASDGNVWLATFTSDTVLKLDATNGANILATIPANDSRGVYELQNGNLLWTSSAGAHVYDFGTATSTTVFTGACYHVNPVNVPPSLVYACHDEYGQGCHSFRVDNSNLFEVFATLGAGKTRLDGNALTFALAGNGYVANWLPGAAASLYVAPSLSATVVANVSNGSETFTPSAPTPIPGGFTTQWTISSEGVLTAGTTANQGADTTPTLAETATQLGLAFYTWFSQNPTEAGSGKIKWEEVGSTVYVTFDNVECALTSPTVAPSTYQFQIDMATGSVTMVWVSMTISSSTSDMIVGCTLAEAGLTPVSQDLSTISSAVIVPDGVLSPMRLTAAPFPVINPSTLVTYTATNVPEYIPTSSVYLGTMFLSVNPLPAGFDLAGILTTVPGCNAYIATLDLDLGGTVNVTPSLSWSFNYDSSFFAPGNVVAAQAVALFDPAFPLLNGEAGGFVLSNGVLSTTQVQ